jgi:hypothetical protein
METEAHFSLERVTYVCSVTFSSTIISYKLGGFIRIIKRKKERKKETERKKERKKKKKK